MLKKICQICESEAAQESCQKCGRLMGQNCKKVLFCKDCSSGRSSVMRKNL